MIAAAAFAAVVVRPAVLVVAGRPAVLVVAGRPAVPASADPFGEQVPVDLDDVRDAACDATARSEVCSPDIPDIPDVPDVPDLPDASAGVGFGQLFVILLVAALVLALAWLVYQFVAGRGGRADDDGDDEELDETEDLDDELPRIIDEERPPDRWRRRAREHRDRGEFRDAIRCEYRALVGDLARAGFVDEIPGRTSGEERAQIADIARPGSPVPERFDAAADLFDRAWFDTATHSDDTATHSDDDVDALERDDLDRDDAGTTWSDIGADDDQRFVAAARAVFDELLTGSGR